MIVPAVVGLDLSLARTGIAHIDGTTSVARCRPAKLRGGERLEHLHTQITPHLAGATIAVIEDYALGAVGVLGKLANAELHGVIIRACYTAGVPHVVKVKPTTLKKYATGRGRADKDDMIATAAVAGWSGGYHDEADAWWLRHMGLAAYNAVNVTSAQVKSLAVIEWPKLV